MNLVLHNIGQLATCPPRSGQADAGLLNDATLVITAGEVAWAGPQEALPNEHADHARFDCRGGLVVPGLIDCHTHLCFGGWRSDEFEMRLAGRSYQEIAAAGGGIASTVAATRAASRQQLIDKAREALDGMLSLGVTTVECKSGYGLNYESELKQLEVYASLQETHPVTLVPTFLGAHIVPPEYRGRREEYVDLLCTRLLPEVARRGLAGYCDVFVETGAFTVAEARRILKEARTAGLGLRVHADQLSDGGGASLAAELGAVSAEHLEHVNPQGIRDLAAAGTVAVSLPLASLYLDEPYLPARDLLAAGVPVAVATDFNPGSAPSFHLPLALTLACLKQSMTPQEALMGATSVAARAIGAGDRLGSLLPGYQADVTLLDAPTLNHWLYHFRDNACTGVLKAGRWAHETHPAAGS